jgi:hypothetical protein
VKFTNYSPSSSNDDDGGGGDGGGSSSSSNVNNNNNRKKRTIQARVYLPMPQHTNNDTCVLYVYRM